MPNFTAASPLLFPDSVLTAAAHPDPYPYYAALLAYRPIYREHRLDLWIALGADAAAEILASEACRVRPSAEPVPATIAGAPAGDVFKHLVRMNDGPCHAKARAAVGGCLAAFDPVQLTALARSRAAALAREPVLDDPGGIDRFARALPVQVVAQMIGLPADAATESAVLIGDFVRCLSPLSGAAEIERSNRAASALSALLRDALRRSRPGGVAMTAELMQSLGLAVPDAGEPDRPDVADL